MWAGTYGRSPAAFYVSPAAAVLSHVPTAVVAPIKREVVVPESVPQTVPDTDLQQSPPGSSNTTPPSLSKAHLPPFETFRAQHGISGGSSASPMTSPSSGSVTSSAAGGEDASPPSAVNLCLGARAAVKPEVAQPVTSFYRHPSSGAAFPFPVWSPPPPPPPATSVVAPEVGTEPRRESEDGHVTEQVLPVRRSTPTTVASTSCCVVSNAGDVCN